MAQKFFSGQEHQGHSRPAQGAQGHVADPSVEALTQLDDAEMSPTDLIAHVVPSRLEGFIHALQLGAISFESFVNGLAGLGFCGLLL